MEDGEPIGMADGGEDGQGPVWMTQEPYSDAQDSEQQPMLGSTSTQEYAAADQSPEVRLLHPTQKAFTHARFSALAAGPIACSPLVSVVRPCMISNGKATS